MTDWAAVRFLVLMHRAIIVDIHVAAVVMMVMLTSSYRRRDVVDLVRNGRGRLSTEDSARNHQTEDSKEPAQSHHGEGRYIAARRAARSEVLSR